MFSLRSGALIPAVLIINNLKEPFSIKRGPSPEFANGQKTLPAAPVWDLLCGLRKTKKQRAGFVTESAGRKRRGRKTVGIKIGCKGSEEERQV